MLFVDYEAWNPASVQASNLLASRDWFSDYDCEITILSIFDVNLGYCKIKTDRRNWEKTAFNSYQLLYKFLQMLFELGKPIGKLSKIHEYYLVFGKIQERTYVLGRYRALLEASERLYGERWKAFLTPVELD